MSAFGNTQGFGSNTQQQPTAVFGSTNTFGAQPNPNSNFGNAFNQPANPAPSAGIFGNNQQQAGGAFGTNQQQLPSTSGSFFNTQNQQQQPGAFGTNQNQNQQQQQQQVPSIFSNFGAALQAAAGQPSTAFVQNPNQQGSAFGTANQKPGTSGSVFGNNMTTPSTGGGIFGSSGANTQQSNQQATGSTFGNTAGTSSAGGGLFRPSVFGNTATPSGGTGIFGSSTNQTQQQQPQQTTGGLFGTTNQNQNQPSTNLFGNANQNQNQPSTGLFGSTNQNQPSTGLFGSINQNQPSTSLFGNTNQNQSSGGLFGSTSNTGTSGGLFGNKPQQPATGSLFGSTVGNPLNASTMPSNSLLGSRVAMTPAQQQADATAQTLQLQQRIESIYNAWNPASPQCRFQYYFYNLVNPNQVSLYTRPNNAKNDALWEQAIRENPDPTSHVPVLAVGFDDLRTRVEAQNKKAEEHQQHLKELKSRIESLNSQHSLSNLSRLLRTTSIQTQLTQRLLKFVQHLHLLIPSVRSSSIRPEEERLRSRLEEVEDELKRGRVKGKLNELWALLGAVNAAKERSNNGFGEWAVVDEDGLAQLAQILSEQQAGLAYVTKILQKALKDVGVIMGTNTAGGGGGGHGGTQTNYEVDSLLSSTLRASSLQ